MLIPSAACPASCSYCFGARDDQPTMQRGVLEAVVRWQSAASDQPLHVTFHGGEPLVPGIGFYAASLPLIREGLGLRQTRFSVQSNLWLLTDDLCGLFREHGVSIGTSLDGPESITDAQRGDGYFRRTMRGIEKARARGMRVGCVCTFTARSSLRFDEVFEFFAREHLDFSIHAAVPSLCRHDAEEWVLPPDAFSGLLAEALDRYIDNLGRIRIGTIDGMCRGVSARRGTICTFRDCLGEHLAVAPGGAVYPCQRFLGTARYRLADVNDEASIDRMECSPAWRMLRSRELNIEKECSGCPHLDYCRGGCPYNAIAGSDSTGTCLTRDPYCRSYRSFFDRVVERTLREVFADQNIAALRERPDPAEGLLRRGPLIGLLRGTSAEHERRTS